MSEPKIYTFETLPEAVQVLSEKLTRLETVLEEIHASLSRSDAERSSRKIMLKEAAAILGVSASTISRWRITTDIPIYEDEGQRPYAYEGEIRQWARTIRKYKTGSDA